MKKISIIFAMAAVALGFSSCKQEDNPQYHAPTTFTINEPALKNQVFRTSSEMTDAATFDLFCSQPDYGYSAICNYSALVSLDPEAAIEDWVALPNQNPTSAAMSIKTFELGVAINKLLNVTDAEDFDAKGYADKTFKCYFKGVCEIPTIEGSKIISSNTVSYDKVMINYAEKLPAWIYICGDVTNPVTGVSNGFTAPSAANLSLYNENFCLYEPSDMIGEKIYVGVFTLNPKADAANPETSNPDNVDQCAQFRFFTELLGWTPTASLGSNEADFYCLPITDKWTAGYDGTIVEQGLGNWGVFVTVNTDITIVVDQIEGKMFAKEGKNTVTFVGRDPEFAPVEE